MSCLEVCPKGLQDFALTIARDLDQLSQSIDQHPDSRPIGGFEARCVSALGIAALVSLAAAYHSLMLIVKMPIATILVVRSWGGINLPSEAIFRERMSKHFQALSVTLSWSLEPLGLVFGETSCPKEKQIVDAAAKDLFRRPPPPKFSECMLTRIKQLGGVALPLLFTGGAIVLTYGAYNAKEFSLTGLSEGVSIAVTSIYRALDFSRWRVIGWRLYDLKPTGWEKEGVSEADLRDLCPLINDFKWTDLSVQCRAQPHSKYSLRDKTNRLEWAKGVLGLEEGYTKSEVRDHSKSFLHDLDVDGQQMTPWCQQASYELHRCINQAEGIASGALQKFSWFKYSDFKKIADQSSDIAFLVEKLFVPVLKGVVKGALAFKRKK